MTISHVLVKGVASGPLLRITEPLSLWGGVEVATGRVVEPAHPQFGESFGGKVVMLPHGRGSSSSSTVLAEMLRTGVGPAAIILGEPDSILLIGALVADRLYGKRCPIVVGSADGEDGDLVRISGSDLTRIPV